jgi:predicted O-linked N-acetylglucosamine transferase (SPINDLY family)
MAHDAMTQDPRRLLDEATQLARAGQLEEALSLVVQLPPSAVKYQFQIDLLTNRRSPGDLQKAEEVCVRWSESAPGTVPPLFQLMQLYWNNGRAELTESLAVRIGELEPGHQFTAYYQAISQQLNGNLTEAIKSHRRALLRNTRQKFTDAELELEVAIAAYEVAAGKYPASPGLKEDALLDTELTFNLLQNATRQWLDSNPDFARLRGGQTTRYSNASYNLGCAEANRYFGVNRALQHFRNALQVNPAHKLARSNYLFVQNYDPELSNQDALDESLKAAAELRRQLGPPRVSWHNDPDPERILRVAYLSSDFHQHSVAHFITPVLEAHNRNCVQTNAYYNGRNRDAWTGRVESAVDRFHRVETMTDHELHQKIVEDQIDILVDLNGFTRGHRLDVLMRRAAPVQVSWIGFPGSTGLDVMDYRIVDAQSDPAPEARRFNSEKLIYMQPVFSVYLPDPRLPDVAPETPALKNGFVTFGSFNALPKLNPPLLKMWGEILSRVDGSKLLLKNKMLDHRPVREEVASALVAAGIDKHRQILLGRTDPPEDHMKTYQRVDLCLDSDPYNGTTTNCDSFIMGVPVLTLTGSRHASRVTTSQLSSLDLDMLIASDRQEYVEIAVRFALDMELLNGIRQGLRERLKDSALMDYQGFTRQLESKYREIWRSWCGEHEKITR